jgi:hypothetical protein
MLASDRHNTAVVLLGITSAFLLFAAAPATYCYLSVCAFLAPLARVIIASVIKSGIKVLVASVASQIS